MFEGIDAAHARIGAAHLDLLRLVVEEDRSQAWKDQGARDVSQWLWMRYGISNWKAQRWVAAAHALERLPRLSEALADGELGIDKVVELARFAAPETEAALIAWAKNVSCGAIRHRGDLAIRALREEVIEAEADRSVSWWYYEDGLRFGLEAVLPAAQGAVLARALDRLAAAIPAMPGEEDGDFASARRADALVALCSGRTGGDAEPDRATTLVVHARLSGLAEATGGCEVEDGPVIQPEVAQRLLCNARLQTVLEDEAGNVVGLGRTSREPSAWMLRQIRYRDRECRFPSCGARRFTEAHHIVWWRDGGRTDLDNLVLICSFHHRLVHEHGWSIRREMDGEITWFHPDGVRYRAGPTPIVAVG